ncbi:BgtAcSP-31482 [Blumeria graminis f. sp. tritici]|uniref:BgtAcSP-31482 n=2 Tax=Blumeria graminis f. sp. tritici TaxID=62690 RepID=A0A9X9MKS4_BLUGR|nr:hypothetical protein BGT96224_AcSP31482 [Blumeria graminis f. sp. tritici 96224]VDB91273.1 BgtAcSP-31482 [Blumeria graminis f. sp. tritici]
MKTLYYICNYQSLWQKVVFLMLLISAEALRTLHGRNESNKPGYNCIHKKYLLEEVEAAREAACTGFISKRILARRPLVYYEDIDVNNMIFGWSLPLSLQKGPNGKLRKFPDKIIFDNRCELKDVLYYNTKSHTYDSCHKVPDDVLNTSSEKNQALKKPFFQCGSISWEHEDIKQWTTQSLPKSLNRLVEMEHTSNKVNGPWKKAILKKEIIRRNFMQNIPYEIILNKQNEVIGVIVTHHISRVSTVSPYFIKDMIYMSTRKKSRGKQTICLECHLDTKSSLVPQNQESGPTNSRKRKKQAQLGSRKERSNTDSGH